MIEDAAAESCALRAWNPTFGMAVDVYSAKRCCTFEEDLGANEDKAVCYMVPCASKTYYCRSRRVQVMRLHCTGPVAVVVRYTSQPSMTDDGGCSGTLNIISHSLARDYRPHRGNSSMTVKQSKARTAGERHFA